MTILVYFLGVNVALIFFMAAYVIFLRNETQFSFNRFFLLAGIGLSFVAPWFPASFVFGDVVPATSMLTSAHWLADVSAVHEHGSRLSSPGSGYSFAGVVEFGYVLVTVVVALLFLTRMSSLVMFIFKSKKYKWHECFVAESDLRVHAFSFFHFIFVGQANRLTDDEKNKILEHERVHARLGHSFDILLITFVQILFWFNPVIRLYKKALVQLHEFEADAHAIIDQDVDGYCLLMAKVALREAGFALGNHFHTSLTTKRITMMRTAKMKVKTWKKTALLVVVPIIFFVVACQEQTLGDLQKVGQNAASAADIPPEVQAKIDEMKKQSPANDLVVIELTEEGLKTLAKLEASNPVTARLDVSTMNTYSKETGAIDRSFAFVRKGTLANQISEAMASSNGVYNFVDNMPVYPGGFDSLRSYIMNTLRYPAEDRARGIQGKVFVQFIVEADGKVTNAEVIKSIGAACDTEALRVVSASKPWMPGTQNGQPVRVKFVVPINFRL